MMYCAMRRKDREVTSLDQILDILQRCDTAHLAMSGEDGPYVVPVSFGFEARQENVLLYFHGAKQGHKHALLARDKRVCVEASIFHRYCETGHSFTAEYESVIGFGTARLCEGEEAAHGIELLMEHCGFPGYDGKPCAALGATAVYCVTLTKVTGKRRFVKAAPPTQQNAPAAP